MFVGYNIPNTVIGMNSTEWPEDLQERSYFTNYLCGDGTPRSCPGPGVSHQRDGSEYIGNEGQIVGRGPTTSLGPCRPARRPVRRRAARRERVSPRRLLHMGRISDGRRHEGSANRSAPDAAVAVTARQMIPVKWWAGRER